MCFEGLVAILVRPNHDLRTWHTSRNCESTTQTTATAKVLRESRCFIEVDRSKKRSESIDEPLGDERRPHANRDSCGCVKELVRHVGSPSEQRTARPASTSLPTS